jgi:crotonobetainyl-CoA:carnitine CoA-transferase CaiB-like acyl-CoA transferase
MLPAVVSLLQRFETRDGEYISSGRWNRFWAELCRKLGREDYIPQYDEGERGEIFLSLEKTFKEKPDEWLEELKDLDAGKVLTRMRLSKIPGRSSQDGDRIRRSKKGKMKLVFARQNVRDSSHIRKAPAVFGSIRGSPEGTGVQEEEIRQMKKEGGGGGKRGSTLTGQTFNSERRKRR